MFPSISSVPEELLCFALGFFLSLLVLFLIPYLLVVQGWVLSCGMDDGQEQDQYEERLKELFDSFDSDGVGSLCREELSALCQSLQLDSATPSLFQTLLQEDDGDMARVSPFPWLFAFSRSSDALVATLLKRKCRSMQSVSGLVCLSIYLCKMHKMEHLNFPQCKAQFEVKLSRSDIQH